MVLMVITGLVFGLGAVLLVFFGNPGNYGFCAACQIRDIAGALGIHNVATLQYIRPEILGFILGSFILAKASDEFRPRGGSNPLTRFILGIVMMLGALVFLGCPLRAILRVAGGDLNGLTGILGFTVGIYIGTIFLKQGYNLGRSKVLTGVNSYAGYAGSIWAMFLLVALISGTSFIMSSTKGPGSMHAPIFISLLLGFLGGAAAFKTRMCLSGGIRDYMLVKDTYLLKIYAVMFFSALLANIMVGSFKFGFDNQPLAHTMHIWNFLGLALTGFAATLAGGCPLRQLIMVGEGNTDAMWCLAGMLVGAGLAHTLNLAGSGAGVHVNGQIAVILGLIITTAIGYFNREKFIARA